MPVQVSFRRVRDVLICQLRLAEYQRLPFIAGPGKAPCLRQRLSVVADAPIIDVTRIWQEYWLYRDEARAALFLNTRKATFLDQ